MEHHHHHHISLDEAAERLIENPGKYPGIILEQLLLELIDAAIMDCADDAVEAFLLQAGKLVFSLASGESRFSPEERRYMLVTDIADPDNGEHKLLHLALENKQFALMEAMIINLSCFFVIGEEEKQ